MFEPLKEYIKEIENNFSNIPNARRELLHKLSGYLRSRHENGQEALLTFICTHNSRRSHLSQIWAAAAAHHSHVDRVQTFSGGTQATAFNPRAVAAVERAGFKVEDPGGDNPHYLVYFDDSIPPVECFSKTFDDPYNPQKDFAAVMTCSDADQNCPFIPGASLRIPLSYRDPKEADGTTHEERIYDERCRQIATEMFYMMSVAIS